MFIGKAVHGLSGTAARLRAGQPKALLVVRRRRRDDGMLREFQEFSIHRLAHRTPARVCLVCR